MQIQSNAREDDYDEHDSVVGEQPGRYVRSEENFGNWTTTELSPDRVPRASTPIQNLTQGNVTQLQPPITLQLKGHIENTWGEFDGDVEKWQGFHDRFKAAVHDDPQIPPAFKILHLLKSLKGDAKRDLGDWPQTEAGYIELWERMQELYKRKYHAAKKLLNRFLALPVLEKPFGNALQKMSNVTHEVIRQLRTLDYPVQHYDLFFVTGIHTRLDNESGKAWELERSSDYPTISQMLSFLDKQARAAQNTFFRSSVFSPSTLENKKSNDQRKRGFYEAKSDERADAKRFKPNSANGDKSDRKCKVCKSGVHPVHKCEKFRKMSLADRRKSAREHGLCYNCLNPSHSSKECKSSTCRRCEKKKHNSLLCPENPLNQSVNVAQVQIDRKKRSQHAKVENKSS